MVSLCHSLQIAIHKATEEGLPRSVDYLIRELYSWFSHSMKRQSTYKDIFETITNREAPLKIPRT
jgi:hypothetical protein